MPTETYCDLCTSDEHDTDHVEFTSHYAPGLELVRCAESTLPNSDPNLPVLVGCEDCGWQWEADHRHAHWEAYRSDHDEYGTWRCETCHEEWETENVNRCEDCGDGAPDDERWCYYCAEEHVGEGGREAVQPAWCRRHDEPERLVAYDDDMYCPQCDYDQTSERTIYRDTVALLVGRVVYAKTYSHVRTYNALEAIA